MDDDGSDCREKCIHALTQQRGSDIKILALERGAKEKHSGDFSTVSGKVNPQRNSGRDGWDTLLRKYRGPIL